MKIKSIVGEIEVSDTVKEKTVLTLIKSMKEDAIRYEEHQRLKSDPSYHRPVFGFVA